MHKHAQKFADFCEENFRLDNIENSRLYNSLTLCIIDCIYSLRANYEKVTEPIVDRYANCYLNRNIKDSSDTVSMFSQRMENFPELSYFADNIVYNHQKLGRTNIPKEKTCYELAKCLQKLKIETIEDFINYKNQNELEKNILKVGGIGTAATSYLFMLTGNSDRCKSDVHVRRCIKEVCGYELSDSEIQRLFTDSVAILSKKYPELTVSALDLVIWNKYHSCKSHK